MFIHRLELNELFPNYKNIENVFSALNYLMLQGDTVLSFQVFLAQASKFFKNYKLLGLSKSIFVFVPCYEKGQVTFRCRHPLTQDHGILGREKSATYLLWACPKHYLCRSLRLLHMVLLYLLIIMSRYP